MDIKKITAFIAIPAVVLIIVYAVAFRGGGKEEIFGGNKNIRFKDVKLFHAPVEFNDPEAKNYFSSTAANPHTLRYFKSLQTHFQEEKTLGDHFAAVHEYMLSILPREKAEELFALYKKFTQYEIDVNSEFQNKKQPGNTSEAITVLSDLQNYRRDYFGKETADSLFGAEVKTLEFGIKRESIVNDGSLYGKDKEKRLKNLGGQFWGADAEEAESYRTDPSARCDEKLTIYKKDLNEMNPGQREAAVRKIREEFFAPAIVDRLEGLDRKLAQQKKNEGSYREKEKAVLTEPGLSREEKESRLETLQNEMMGEDADVFRKKEAIRKALQSGTGKR
ncbi:MAG: lipase chaperone family protein [Spirochaetes bacterium]|jgi:lipase chaperone LimK|nr:lipase chaperone family protein [Spirochaetota bacterium]